MVWLLSFFALFFLIEVVVQLNNQCIGHKGEYAQGCNEKGYSKHNGDNLMR